jgi:hypothetical protein
MYSTSVICTRCKDRLTRRTCSKCSGRVHTVDHDQAGYVVTCMQCGQTNYDWIGQRIKTSARGKMKTVISFEDTDPPVVSLETALAFPQNRHLVQFEIEFWVLGQARRTTIDWESFPIKPDIIRITAVVQGVFSKQQHGNMPTMMMDYVKLPFVFETLDQRDQALMYRNIRQLIVEATGRKLQRFGMDAITWEYDAPLIDEYVASLSEQR